MEDLQGRSQGRGRTIDKTSPRTERRFFGVLSKLLVSMTTNFYAPPSQIRGNRIVLPEDEVRHLQSVLRAREGDTVVVVDGEGGWYRAQIDHLSAQQAVCSVLESRRDVGEPDVHLTVGMGLLTKRSRFETFVEKAVELGVGRIVPLQTRHTESESIRRERLHNVMVAALKQCRRSRLPKLTEPQSLGAVLGEEEADLRLMCHGGEEALPLLPVLEEDEGGENILVLVGPEGGFAASEVDAAREAGCTPVSLGRRRLRAETAGITSASTVMMSRQRRTA